MDKSSYDKFLEMLIEAGLEYTTSPTKKYMAFEDQECTSIMLVEFDKDQGLVNITAYHDFKSLDEVKNLWRDS